MRFPPKESYPREFLLKDDIWFVKFKKIEEYGLCCPSEQTIYIRVGLSPEDRMMTFIHELIHAIEFTYNFKLNHDHVYKMENGITSFIKENF